MRRAKTWLTLVWLAVASLLGCDGQVPGIGPTCTGPAAGCSDVLERLPPLIAAARAEGLPDVGPILDYVLVAGPAFGVSDVLDGRPLCGLNRELVDPRRGLRCEQHLAADLGLCGDTLAEVQAHEYLHCAGWAAELDGDGDHSECARWGPQPRAGTCLDAPPGALQRILARLAGEVAP